MDSKTQKKTQNHIACSVKNCTYHGQQDCCNATRIQVGPTHAVSSKDTVCATFMPEGKSTF